MGHSKRARQRCTECRSWFTPSVRALETQRVCSTKCRKDRDLRLARERRSQDLDRYRDEERERQRKCRRARLEAGGEARPGVAKCHAPPSAAKVRRLQRKVLGSWDKAAALSRATIAQELGEILGKSEVFRVAVGTEP
jgi:hypothetical protein